MRGRRVVITGLGAVSALGTGAAALWEGLLRGESGLRRIQRFDPSGFPCRLGGEAQGFVAREHVPKSYRKAVKVMARDSELAVGAARLAVLDAGLRTRGTEPEEGGFEINGARTGCQIGAGLIAAETQELTAALATSRAEDGRFDLRRWGSAEGGEGQMGNLPPLWMLKYLPNMLACHVTIIHGAEGPSNTITCAEASGLLSIGEGARVIERDDADVCFAGGAESKLNLMGLFRMDLARRVAHTGEETEGSGLVRPYDPDSPGGLLAEAGGILMLESLEHAQARGAGRVYAEVLGFGAAQTPGPVFPGLFDPEPDGGIVDEGLGRAITRALADAGVGPWEIDAVVPLASGIPHVDVGELGALRRVFGDRLADLEIVTVAPSVGNAMAGQGGLLASVGALSVHHQSLPARRHAGRVPEGVRVGAAEARDARLERVLVCSGALGGQNAALVLGRRPEGAG